MDGPRGIDFSAVDRGTDFSAADVTGDRFGGGDNFRETEPHNWLIYASSALASANERQYTSI